jgi:CRP-like cAMP-binding protein
MNHFNLTNFLTSNIEIDESEIVSIIDNCTLKKVTKGTYLLQANEICSHTFFVEKGLLRQYSIDERGKEHILQFAPENWFVSDRESVFFNRPSNYYIQALEDSEIALLDNNFINLLSQKLPSFIEFNNRLLHNHILHLQSRINLLLSASAENRYLQFIKLYPDILLRVPQTMVASYLGITPESLSRVRKDLANKNFNSK